MRALRLVALVALVALVTACGGESNKIGSVPEGASFAPASTAAYIVAVTDVESEQWGASDRLLRRFPGRAELLADLNEELAEDDLTWERDVRPALGEDVHVVWLDFAAGGENVVGFTKPRDEAKLNALLECCDEPMVHRKIEDWTVFAETDALLDRFSSARSADSLSEDEDFRNAMERLPDDSLARAYVSGKQIDAAIERAAAQNADARTLREIQKSLGTIESLSFAATARDEGIRMDAVFASNTDPKVNDFSAALDEQIPAGALAYLSFGDLRDFWRGFLDSAQESIPNFEQQRRQLETALGFSLEEDLFPLFAEEGALAVYRATQLAPGVTFMLDVEGEEDKARNVINRLGALLELGEGGSVRKLTIEGVEVTHLNLEGEGLEFFVGVSDGLLVVSTTQTGFRNALSAERTLRDDARFEQAQDAAELPDESLGYVYVDLNQAVQYFLEAAEGLDIDPKLRANVEPLETALLYAERDGNRVLFSGFLTIE